MMKKDEGKTIEDFGERGTPSRRAELIAKLVGLRQRLAELEASEAERKRAEGALRLSLEETAYSERLLLALSKAAQAVQRARTPEEVYRTIGNEVVGLGYHAAILTLTADQAHLAVSHLTHEPALLQEVEKLTDLSAQDYRLPVVPGGFAERIIEEGEITFSESFVEQFAEAWPRPLRPMACRLAATMGMEQGICAPLRVGGETAGILIVTGTGLSEADVPVAAAFANQTAIALENARLHEQLKAQRVEE